MTYLGPISDGKGVGSIIRPYFGNQVEQMYMVASVDHLGPFGHTVTRRHDAAGTITSTANDGHHDGIPILPMAM